MKGLLTVPEELQDIILDFYLFSNPQARRAVTSLSKRCRQRLRHHRTTKLSVHTTEDFDRSDSPTVVSPEKLANFVTDVQEFCATFKATSISFGEIESVQIHLPFEDSNLARALKRTLSLLSERRPITFLKVTGSVDNMDLVEFIAYVRKLGSSVSHARTLELVFQHNGEYGDGDEDEEVSVSRPCTSSCGKPSEVINHPC